jgi:hypothetical protein
MVAAAVTASALRTERTCDWLEELERIGDLADSLPADAARAVTRVVIGVLGEPTTTAEQCARALALLAAIDPDRPKPDPVPLRALAAAASPVVRLGLAS